MRWVELFSALLNIGYVLGLIWHKRWAWPAGGLGCILAVWLFFDQHLYLEALLNVAYIGMAGYGWIRWGQPRDEFPIYSLSMRQKAAWILGGLAVTLHLGGLFSEFTPNPNPFLDAGIFTFSLAATYGQAQRCLDNWWAWIAINAAMVALCLIRDMPIYAVYSAFMAGMAWKGWGNWKRESRAQDET